MARVFHVGFTGLNRRFSLKLTNTTPHPEKKNFSPPVGVGWVEMGGGAGIFDFRFSIFDLGNGGIAQGNK
jgi:hypothetical protein